MIGKTDYDFLSKEEADKLSRVKRQALETGKPVHFETSLISREGKPEFFDGTYVPKFDAQDKIDGSIGYFRNVTELKRAEKELKEREEQLRLFVEPSPAAIGLFDREMRYLALSRRWLDPPSICPVES